MRKRKGGGTGLGGRAVNIIREQSCFFFVCLFVCLFSATKHNRLHQQGESVSHVLNGGGAGEGQGRAEHAQLRWKPFSMVAAKRRSLMMSSEEYSGSFR